MSASERRILITKWVANAWQKVCSDKDMVIHSFKKCGISVNLDGSENKSVNIEGLPDYEYRMVVDEGDDDDGLVDEGDDDDEVMAAGEPAGNAAAVETMDIGDD